MKLIECKLGPAETNIAGSVYNFVRDRYGRHVASVDNIEHIACLLAVEHYREVPEIPEEFDPPAPTQEVADALAEAEAKRLQDEAEVKAKAEADAAAEQARLKAEADARDEAEEAEREAARRAADEDERNQLAKPTDPILVKGIGPAMKTKLADVGIKTLAQIAALTAEDEARLDDDLKLKGAIDRDNWIGQAKDLLAAE